MREVDESYAACERLARAHYENFPVASRLLPRHLRKHVAAIYAFARTADDIADEPGREPAERLALLAALHAAVEPLGRPLPTPAPADARRDGTERKRGPQGRGGAEDAGGTEGAAVGTERAGRTEGAVVPPPARRLPLALSEVPIAVSVPKSVPVPAELLFFLPALGETVARFHLPVSLLTDLLSAFTQDVTTTRYETWVDVIDYCRRSADPVGRLVLRLNGYNDPALDRASDAVCTALQLTNFWQDLAVDWSRGRLYVPAEEWRAHGAALDDLDRARWPAEWRATLAACGCRTRASFVTGRPVCDGVSGRLRYELRATWLGGMRILERLDAGGYDVFRARPSLGAMDAMVIACRTLAWRRAP